MIIFVYIYIIKPVDRFNMFLIIKHGMPQQLPGSHEIFLDKTVSSGVMHFHL